MSSALSGCGTNAGETDPDARGLHSSTFWLNVSAFCWTGGAFRGSFRGDVCGVTGYQGVFRVYFVSGTAQVEQWDECKPLPDASPGEPDPDPAPAAAAASDQGLTLVPISAQLEHFHPPYIQLNS